MFVSSLGYPACNAHAPWSYVACPALQCHIIASTARFSGKKVTENKMFVLIFSATCLKHFLFEEELSEIWSKNVYWSSCEVPNFNETLISSTIFRKIFEYKISWIPGQWEPSYSKRTDMTNLIIAFLNFVNARKNEYSYITKRLRRRYYLRIII